MVTTDPIADMLTRIRNANQQKHETVSIPYSNLKNDLANILKKSPLYWSGQESSLPEIISMTLEELRILLSMTYKIY